MRQIILNHGKGERLKIPNLLHNIFGQYLPNFPRLRVQACSQQLKESDFSPVSGT